MPVTTGKILKFLRDNPGISLNKAVKQLNRSRSLIQTVAKSHGIEFPMTPREMICKDAPEACFSCPFKDCKNGGHMTSAEVKFAENGVGKMYGKKTEKGAKK